MPEFYATYANEKGEIFDDPNHSFVACSAQHAVIPDDDDMIPMPEGSRFFTMPGYAPLGWNDELEQVVRLSEQYENTQAVSAFLPPGYTRLYLPGIYYTPPAIVLPLWSYTALAWKDNGFWVPAVKIDDDAHWKPSAFDDLGIEKRIEKKRRRLKGNRLVEQLAVCARDAHCFAAKNFFYERWECPVPVSPSCNAECIGCLSLQPSREFSASMERIKFIPTPAEITEIAVDHLKHAPDPMISFGQGCEGDPLLQADTIEKAIKKIKSEIPDSTINMNTNASMPDMVKKLADAGLDSIRVSMNSVRVDRYSKYFRPNDYMFRDVLESMKIASDSGLFVNLNLLIFPGISDQEDELESLILLIRSCGVHRIQMKNLCIDPRLYLETVGYPELPGVGITSMMNALRKEFPDIQFGYFNLSKTHYSKIFHHS